MQAMSCGSPLVPRGGMTIPELDKPEAANPVKGGLTSVICLPATKPDHGKPMRVSFESDGQKVCLTPKSVQAPGGTKMHGSQFQKSAGVHDLHQPNVGKSASLRNQPTIASNFTTYFNLVFEPVEAIESPPKVQKQPPCIPVDSTGQRLWLTRSSSSPGTSKLRYPRCATSYQPVETIKSSAASRDQTQRVLGDSNGHWAQETPKVSKQCSVPRERSTAFGIEKMAPRGLFDNSHDAFSTAKAHLAVGSVTKKRARGEDNVMRDTRSKTEAEKIAGFLRSPAARVRPDGTREEYRLGVPDVLVEQFVQKKMSMRSNEVLAGCDDSMMGDLS